MIQRPKQVGQNSWLALWVFASSIYLPGCAPPSHSAAKIYELVSPSVVKIYGLSTVAADNRAGTGFVVNLPSGPALVTNRHIVEMAEVVVVESGTSTWSAPEWEEHSILDLAILPLREEMPALELGSATSLRPGSRVFTVGHPLGESTSIHEGIVSTVEGASLVFSAPLSSGASGSPLLDDAGAVAGVCHAFVPTAQNYNLALPSDFILMKSGWVKKKANPDPSLAPYLESVARGKVASVKNHSSWKDLSREFPEWEPWRRSTDLTRRPLIAEVEAALSAVRAVDWVKMGSSPDQAENRVLIPLLRKRISSLTQAWELHQKNIERSTDYLPSGPLALVLSDTTLIPDAIESLSLLVEVLENPSSKPSDFFKSSLSALDKYLGVEERWGKGIVP